jgi:hypothetical protein
LAFYAIITIFVVALMDAIWVGWQLSENRVRFTFTVRLLRNISDLMIGPFYIPVRLLCRLWFSLLKHADCRVFFFFNRYWQYSSDKFRAQSTIQTAGPPPPPPFTLSWFSWVRFLD